MTSADRVAEPRFDGVDKLATEIIKRKVMGPDFSSAGILIDEVVGGPDLSDAEVPISEVMGKTGLLENVGASFHDVAEVVNAGRQFWGLDPATVGAGTRTLNEIYEESTLSVMEAMSTNAVLHTMGAADLFVGVNGLAGAVGFDSSEVIRAVGSDKALKHVLEGIGPLIDPLSTAAFAKVAEPTPAGTATAEANRNFPPVDVQEFGGEVEVGEVGEGNPALPPLTDLLGQFYDNMAGLSTRQKTLGTIMLSYAIVLYVYFPAVMAGVSDPQNAEFSTEQAKQVVFWVGVIHPLLWGIAFTDD